IPAKELRSSVLPFAFGSRERRRSLADITSTHKFGNRLYVRRSTTDTTMGTDSPKRTDDRTSPTNTAHEETTRRRYLGALGAAAAAGLAGCSGVFGQE